MGFSNIRHLFKNIKYRLTDFYIFHSLRVSSIKTRIKTAYKTELIFSTVYSKSIFHYNKD